MAYFTAYVTAHLSLIFWLLGAVLMVIGGFFLVGSYSLWQEIRRFERQKEQVFQKLKHLAALFKMESRARQE